MLSLLWRSLLRFALTSFADRARRSYTLLYILFIVMHLKPLFSDMVSMANAHYLDPRSSFNFK